MTPTALATTEREPAGPIALGVRDAVKHYGGVTALAGVDLEVRRGESVAVIGANGAGKSTVVRILTGAVQPDAGMVIVDDEPARLRTVRDARRHGIGFVPQELAVSGDLTIAENVLAGGWTRRRGVVDHRRGLRLTAEVTSRVGLTRHPTELVRHLNSAEQRLVMIARALVTRPTTLILDEPTAALADREARRVVGVLNELRDGTISLIYISHRMGEIEQICDRVVVLRNGRVVMTGPADAATVERAVALGIAGGTLEPASAGTAPTAGPAATGPARPETVEAPVLKVRGLTNHALRDVHLDVRQGEIVGLAGLLGSGRSEILRAIAGADRVSGGTIEWDGREVRFRSPREAIRHGVALLPEDRRNQGGLLNLTIRENIVLPHIPSTRGGWLRQGIERRLVRDAIARYGIKAPHAELALHALSGGNQQKVILARWLVGGKRLLLLDEPTAGIDVVAKHELMLLVRQAVDAGGAAIMASSELDELTAYCDRIVVVRDGTVATEVSGHIDVADLARLCDQSQRRSAE